MSETGVSAAPRNDKWVVFIPGNHEGGPYCREILQSSRWPYTYARRLYEIEFYDPVRHAKLFNLTRSVYTLVYYCGDFNHKCTKCGRNFPSKDGCGEPHGKGWSGEEICRKCWAADIIANSVYDPATNW